MRGNIARFIFGKVPRLYRTSERPQVPLLIQHTPKFDFPDPTPDTFTQDLLALRIVSNFEKESSAFSYSRERLGTSPPRLSASNKPLGATSTSSNTPNAWTPLVSLRISQCGTQQSGVLPPAWKSSVPFLCFTSRIQMFCSFLISCLSAHHTTSVVEYTPPRM